MHEQSCPTKCVIDSTAVSLDSLKEGARAVVASVSASNRTLCHRLLAMGIVVGATVEMVCAAPLGDPLQIKALGYKLSLRVSEAQSITVIPL